MKRPTQIIGALILWQMIVWTLAPALTHSAPTLDTVEGYVWGREHVVATFKHPNLPGLILEGWRLVTGQVGWPAYLSSQIFIAATFVAVFALGCELMDPRRAVAGTLLLTGVFFFSWPTIEFNHNVAQMPFWALVSLFLWRATSRGKYRDWLLLGLCGGLAIWAKYSSALFLLFALLWILWDQQSRRTVLTSGPWLALLLFLLVVTPQVMWLLKHDYGPFRYAAERASAGKWYSQILFLLNLAMDIVPMLAMLFYAGLGPSSSAQAAQPTERVGIDHRALRFLLLLGTGPLAITFIGGLLSRADLKTAWAAPMFNLWGLLAVAFAGRSITDQTLKRLQVVAITLLLVVPAAYACHVAIGPIATGKLRRPNWPQVEVSQRLEEVWRASTDAPLRIVVGDVWTAGQIGLQSSQPPSVLISGADFMSPWITPDRLRDEGALYVWRADESMPIFLPDRLIGLEQHTVSIPVPSYPRIPPIEIHYAIQSPAAR